MTEPIRLSVQPLTPSAYRPFGDVIMAAPSGEEGKPANAGTARRFDHLASLENLRPDSARLNVSTFRCAPRPSGLFMVEMLEKHPRSTQIFIPMMAKRFVVIVAEGGDKPDLKTLSAFEALGPRGVSYRPGIWHHPMLALDETTDFACFVYEDGTSDDCVVFQLSEQDRHAALL